MVFVFFAAERYEIYGTVRATPALVNQKFSLRHETPEHPRERRPGRHLRFEGDALPGPRRIHPQRQNRTRNRLPDGPGRDLSPDPAAAESGHVRDDLHGRLRHTADERGHQRQLHRRNRISPRGRHVRTLHQHPRKPLEHPRKGRVEERCRRNRIIRSLHVGRRRRVAPLAQPPQGCRKTLRPSESGDELGLSGRLGEVLPTLADRAPHRAPHPRAEDPRHRCRPENLRRKHHLHRPHRRRDVVRAERRRRSARQGPRRL